jgi:hypothetical protein
MEFGIQRKGMHASGLAKHSCCHIVYLPLPLLIHSSCKMQTATKKSCLHLPGTFGSRLCTTYVTQLRCTHCFSSTLDVSTYWRYVITTALSVLGTLCSLTDMSSMQPFKPLLKFILVKTVIFLTFWQVGRPDSSVVQHYKVGYQLASVTSCVLTHHGPVGMLK